MGLTSLFLRGNLVSACIVVSVAQLARAQEQLPDFDALQEKVTQGVQQQIESLQKSLPPEVDDGWRQVEKELKPHLKNIERAIEQLQVEELRDKAKDLVDDVERLVKPLQADYDAQVWDAQGGDAQGGDAEGWDAQGAVATEELTERESLQRRFMALAGKLAESLSEEQLEAEVSRLETLSQETDAQNRLSQIERTLKSVLEEYPETDAGRKANAALSALKSSQQIPATIVEGGDPLPFPTPQPALPTPVFPPRGQLTNGRLKPTVIAQDS